MLKESILLPSRSIQTKTYVWFDILGLTNKTTGRKNKPVDSLPGRARRKVKLPCSLLSFSCDWKVNWQREASYDIQRGNFIALSVLEEYGKGYQLPGVMWSQLWCWLLMGNRVENTLLAVLGAARAAAEQEQQGLLLPPQVWLPVEHLQLGMAAHRDHAGPSVPPWVLPVQWDFTAWRP